MMLIHPKGCICENPNQVMLWYFKPVCSADSPAVEPGPDSHRGLNLEEAIRFPLCVHMTVSQLLEQCPFSHCHAPTESRHIQRSSSVAIACKSGRLYFDHFESPSKPLVCCTGGRRTLLAPPCFWH